jgi:hypothetical protein
LTANYLANYDNTGELAGLFRQSASMPFILEKIGSEHALQALKRVLDFAGESATAPTIQAYCRIVQRQPAFEPYQQHWESVLGRQITAAQKRKRFMARSSSVTGNQFLLGVLLEEYDIHVSNVFALLGVQATSVNMEAIRMHLQDKDEEQRARAQEILEHVLPVQWRSEVMGLVDAQLKTPEPANAVELLRDAMESESSEPILLGAIYTAALNNSRNALPMIQQLLSHPGAVVRETALFALAHIEAPEKLSPQVNKMLSDASEPVRRLAQSVIADPGQFGGKEEPA